MVDGGTPHSQPGPSCMLVACYTLDGSSRCRIDIRYEIYDGSKYDHKSGVPSRLKLHANQRRAEIMNNR